MSLIPSFFGSRSIVFDPFSVDIWNPFEASSSFPMDMSLSRRNAANDAVDAANTRMDWKETSDAHIFNADLPGLNKDELKIEVEDGRVLQISGERNRENEEKNDCWHRVERLHGKFIRRFRLPENAKMEDIKAAMENGVLTISVPKQPQPQSEVKQTQISG